VVRVPNLTLRGFKKYGKNISQTGLNCCIYHIRTGLFYWGFRLGERDCLRVLPHDESVASQYRQATAEVEMDLPHAGEEPEFNKRGLHQQTCWLCNPTVGKRVIEQ
jgi:hypothetical protein